MGGPDINEVQVDPIAYRHTPSTDRKDQEMTTSNPPYELKHVDTAVGHMAYRETGSPDAPVALYVHRVIVNLWRHQLEAFTDIRRNLAVDLLGALTRRVKPANPDGRPVVVRLWELDR